MKLKAYLCGWLFLLGTAFAGSANPNFVIRALDRELQPLPGVEVTLVRPGGQPSDAGAVRGVTNARGEAGFLTAPPGRYEAVCVLNGFIAVRLGPFDLSSNSALNATVLLNLSWDSPDKGMINPQK